MSSSPPLSWVSLLPKPKKDGSNFEQWHDGLLIYAYASGSMKCLLGTAVEPQSWDDVMEELAPLITTTIPQPADPNFLSISKARKDEEQLRADHNKDVRARAKEAEVHHQRYQSLLGSIELAFISTLPADVWSSIRHYGSINSKYLAIQQRYQQIGPKKKFNIWKDFKSMRCDQYSSTIAFCDKFRAQLTRIGEFELALPDDVVKYTFLLAIEDGHPKFVNNCKHDLRVGKICSLDNLIAELCAVHRPLTRYCSIIVLIHTHQPTHTCVTTVDRLTTFDHNASGLDPDGQTAPLHIACCY